MIKRWQRPELATPAAPPRVEESEEEEAVGSDVARALRLSEEVVLWTSDE